MNGDYNSIESLSEDEFRRRTAGRALKDKSRYTKSDSEDIEKIELLLDVRPGLLKDEEFYLGNLTCQACGRVLTVYDFVLSGLIDGGHSKSFELHVLVGNKFFINKARRIRCSACGTMTRDAGTYHMPAYDCDAVDEVTLPDADKPLTSRKG
jgi:hypothetical protein